MSPFYQDEFAALYCGDARELLPLLERDSADLLVTDPPYGVSFRSNRGQNFEAITGDDDATWVPETLDLALGALRKFRHAYVFGPEGLLPERLAARTELIWDKCQHGSGDLSSPWGPSHERITFASFIPSPANRKRGDGRASARMRSGSILRYPRPNASGVTRHPTEKPVALLRRLIESSSLLGETVLDPFAGCGSTLVAATLEGRRSIGIEIDMGYCSIAAERLSSAAELAKGAQAA